MHFESTDVYGVLVVIGRNIDPTREERRGGEGRGEGVLLHLLGQYLGHCNLPSSHYCSTSRMPPTWCSYENVGMQTYFSVNNIQCQTLYYKRWWLDGFYYALLTFRVCFGEFYTFSDIGRTFFILCLVRLRSLKRRYVMIPYNIALIWCLYTLIRYLVPKPPLYLRTWSSFCSQAPRCFLRVDRVS